MRRFSAAFADRSSRSHRFATPLLRPPRRGCLAPATNLVVRALLPVLPEFSAHLRALCASALSFLVFLSPLMKHKKHSRHHEPKPCQIIPLKLLSQIEHRKNREHRQRDYFLNRLHLARRKFIRAYSVRRHLKAILKKCNPPTHKDHLPQRLAPILQMPIPGKRHKNIRYRQQENRSHVSKLLSSLW